MQYAAAAGAAWAEKLDSVVPPVEEAIARDRDLLIINPDPLPLGPDGHREPVAGPARNLAREERTGTVQGIDVELWVALDQFALPKMQRSQHAARLQHSPKSSQ